MAQVRENGKRTNTLKSLIKGHSKKLFPESPFIIQTHIFDSQRDRHLYQWIKIIFPIVTVNQSFHCKLKLVYNNRRIS